MRITSSIKPEFSFNQKAKIAIIVFVDNLVANQDGTWSYDQYTLQEPWKMYLFARVQACYDEWLQKAKDAEYNAEAAKVRAYRDGLLTECDTLYCNAENWALMDKITRTAWQTYKQALRDVPEQQSFPYSAAWPVRPELSVDLSQPTETDVMGQQVIALTLSNGAKDTMIQRLGAQVVQLQLQVATLKEGTV